MSTVPPVEPTPAASVEWLRDQFDCTITIRFDPDEGAVVYDLDNLDPWLAESYLRQILQRVIDDLPYPKLMTDLIYNHPSEPGNEIGEADESDDDDDDE